jgi:hypothetical protein
MSKSIRTNAVSIGKKDAESEALCIAIRKAYVKAKPEAQAELAREFKIGYIAGREKVSLTVATKIFDAGKGVNAIDVHAIDRATSGFNHHIVSKLDKPAQAPAKHKRVSTERRALAMDFLSNFDGENLQEQIKEAIALLNALK